MPFGYSMNPLDQSHGAQDTAKATRLHVERLYDGPRRLPRLQVIGSYVVVIGVVVLIVLLNVL
jgi:hypothetical protein